MSSNTAMTSSWFCHRGCEISILEEFQSSVEQSPEQLALTLKIALPGAGEWTR